MQRIVTAIIVLGSTAFAQDFFPLHTENQWIYRTRGFGAGSITTVEITGTRVVNGQTYAVATGFGSDPELLRLGAGGVLYRYQELSRQESVWADFSVAAGATYKTSLNICNQSAVVSSRTATADTPAGVFANSFAVDYPDGNCNDAGFNADAYAPGVGLVRREWSGRGAHAIELIYARIGGVTVYSEPSVGFSLAIDRAVYITRPNAAPPELSARITVANSLPSPIELAFNSGQRFDVVIRDSGGREVDRWSIDKLFVAVAGTEVIGPGERNWVATMRLGRSAPLPAGRYTCEVVLTTTVRQWAASVGFEIATAP